MLVLVAGIGLIFWFKQITTTPPIENKKIKTFSWGKNAKANIVIEHIEKKNDYSIIKLIGLRASSISQAFLSFSLFTGT